MNILRKQFLQHVGQTSPDPMMIEVQKAEGVFFYTPEGKKYFDLISGVSVNNVGHANPKVIDAIIKQTQDFMHIMVYGEMIEKPQVKYASKITSLMPDNFDAVYFVNSGAEAIEVAMKLAKRATGRGELISCMNAYHGSTHGALSIMGGEEFKQAYRPLIPNTKQIKFNNFDDINLITKNTASVIMEVVQGEAGIIPPSNGYLEAVRKQCSKVGALLIFDEIQTGMGRCGELFAFMKHNVNPDIITVAKAFGGGMPLGGVISSKKNLDLFTNNPVLGHISTFGGHPISCAAGLAALEYTLEENLIDNVEKIGQLYENNLAKHKQVIEVRRDGLMIAVELGSQQKLFKIMSLFKENGILSDWFLFCNTAFRISPPLTISIEETKQSLKIINLCLDNLN